MAQHIGLALQDEDGKLIEQSDLNYALISNKLETLREFSRRYPWISTIDPYGDTLFNVLQTPHIIEELTAASREVSAEETVKLIQGVCAFLKKTQKEPHRYVKFIGD